VWDRDSDHDDCEAGGDHASAYYDDQRHDHNHAATGYHDHGGPGVDNSTSGKPLDWLLASINANDPALKTTDPSIKVFREHLLSLETKTTSDQQEIADITVKAWQIANDEGYEDSLLRVMEELDRSIPEDFPKMDLAEIGAAWLTLRSSE